MVTKYDRALARFRRAEAALAAAAHEPDEDRYNDLVGDFNNALRRLLRTPAPDLPALSLKIDLTIDQEAWELTGADPCLAALRRDARRLCARSWARFRFATYECAGVLSNPRASAPRSSPRP